MGQQERQAGTSQQAMAAQQLLQQQTQRVTGKS